MNASYVNFAGIDTSKPFLDLHILPKVVAERFDNSAAGHRKLIKVLKEHQVDLVVLEASGGYEHAFVVAMVCAGLRVHVAQPQIIHAFARSLKLRAKNDKIDAANCARYAQDRGHELRVIEKIDKTLETLQALVTRRDQLVTMRSMEKNREKQGDDKATAASVKRSIRFLVSEIKKVEATINEMIKADPVLNAKADKLRENTGVGPQTARVLIAMLPELGKVDQGQNGRPPKSACKRLNALVGVAPYDNESGSRSIKPRRISGGRTMVRNCLFMACLTAIVKDPVMEVYYKKMMARGLAHKTAMMACIRKLLANLDRQMAELNKTFATIPQTIPPTIQPTIPQTIPQTIPHP